MFIVSSYVLRSRPHLPPAIMKSYIYYKVKSWHAFTPGLWHWNLRDNKMLTTNYLNWYFSRANHNANLLNTVTCACCPRVWLHFFWNHNYSHFYHVAGSRFVRCAHNNILSAMMMKLFVTICASVPRGLGLPAAIGQLSTAWTRATKKKK